MLLHRGPLLVIFLATVPIFAFAKQNLHGIFGSLKPNISNSSNATYNIHKLEVWFDPTVVTNEDQAMVK